MASPSCSGTGGTVPGVDDAEAMGLALDEARRAGDRGEIPVGAVVVVGDLVVASAGNERESVRQRPGSPHTLAELVIDDGRIYFVLKGLRCCS